MLGSAPFSADKHGASLQIDTQCWAGALCHRDHTSPLPIRPLNLYWDLFDREQEPIWPGTYLIGNPFGRQPI